MINGIEILETVKMIKDHHLDIRTVTMGISLLDCISESANRTAEKVYDKICHSAGKLVSVSDEIADMYGIPIVNKRVSVTPIAIVGASSMGFEKIALAMDSAAEAIGIDFIGGYSALVQKGTTDPEREFFKGYPRSVGRDQKGVFFRKRCVHQGGDKHGGGSRSRTHNETRGVSDPRQGRYRRG